MQPVKPATAVITAQQKEFVHHGKTTRANRTLNPKVIVHDVVISSTKTASDAQ